MKECRTRLLLSGVIPDTWTAMMKYRQDRIVSRIMTMMTMLSRCFLSMKSMNLLEELRRHIFVPGCRFW